MSPFRSIDSLRYVALQPDLTQTRGDSHLLVWGDLPHWMVVDGEYRHFLQALRPDKSWFEIVQSNGFSSRRKSLAAELKRLETLGIVHEVGGPKSKKSATEHQFPDIENMAIFVSHQCNLRCRFCYALPMLQAKDDRALSAGELVSFLKVIRPYVSRDFSLFLLGGEPLLAPDTTLKLAEFARSQRWPCLVSTNGQRVTREFALAAHRTQLQIQVSLDSPNEDRHDALRGQGTFEKAIAGVRILREAGVHVVISMVSHADNIGELEAYYDLALILGIQEARFIPLKRLGGGCASDGPNPPAMHDLILVARDLFRRRPEFIKLAGRDAFSILATACQMAAPRRSCGAGTQTLLLDNDGTLYPCLNLHTPEFKFGNLRDPQFDFKRKWRESSVLRNVRGEISVSSPGNACADCVVRHWCLGGCHGETFSRLHGLNHRAANCADQKSAILEMFWVLSENSKIQRQAVWQC